jgi:hypothetical protein
MERLRQAIDVRAGLVGATLMAAIVAWINAGHGALPASTAAAKQWVYTFFMGGYIVQLCARLARRPGPRWLALLAAVAVPTAVTVGATFLVHSARGTPRPVASTVPVALISPPSFALWGLRARRVADHAARAGA